MIDLAYSLAAGTVRLAQTTLIKAAGVVPVRITFDEAPGEISSLSLALGKDQATPEILAYLEDFTAESETVWVGDLDATDERLQAWMTGKAAVTVKGELSAVIDGRTIVCPEVSITVQRVLVTGPESPESGPSYYTAAQVDAAIAAAVANVFANAILTDQSDGHTYKIISTGGVLGLQLIS